MQTVDCTSHVAHPTSAQKRIRSEWPTIFLFLGCFSLWGVAVFILPLLHPAIGLLALVPALVLHSSLSHEVLHGHPFASKKLNEACVMVQPGLFIPYLRFRDTHLAHHRDARLTDPYDDPESNYLDPVVWSQLSKGAQVALRFNNTLLGRILIGPLVSQWAFMRGDLKAILQVDRPVLAAWIWHVPGVVLVMGVVLTSQMPLWIYILGAYCALSVLKIRTFLEHQAHLRASGRSVIIEDKGILAFLFLNNNLHAVHHMHPSVPWYHLRGLYWGNKSRYVTCNGGYVYGSYMQVFRRYFWTRKDPVAHPLWPMR